MVKTPGWENPLSDDWITSFQRVLELSNYISMERQANIEFIEAMKLAGISKEEAGLRVAGILVSSQRLDQAAIFQKYLNEIYDMGIKETTDVS
jgi:hypothetical protein